MQSLSLVGGLRQFAETVLLAVGALLPIVDPLGGAPIYLAMTADVPVGERARLAQLVAINSFLLLIASVLVGAYVLDIFGVSIPAVQVAGGIVVCAVGWSLLNTPTSPAASDRTATPTTADRLSERAFYPLTMPLTVGPGSISVALTLGANPPREFRALAITSIAHGIGVFIVALSVWVCYRYAGPILRKLGPTGTSVVLRLSAFILLCIGVQIVWNGLDALLLRLMGRPGPQ